MFSERDRQPLTTMTTWEWVEVKRSKILPREQFKSQVHSQTSAPNNRTVPLHRHPSTLDTRGGGRDRLGSGKVLELVQIGWQVD